MCLGWVPLALSACLPDDPIDAQLDGGFQQGVQVVSAALGQRPTGATANGLQAVVDDLRHRLSITQRVTVALVEAHPRVVSVERRTPGDDVFLLTVDQPFFDRLTDLEIRAVIGHELGHVWIFTHHPYLQTEALANKIAMRVISRDSLSRSTARCGSSRVFRVTLPAFSESSARTHRRLCTAVLCTSGPRPKMAAVQNTGVFDPRVKAWALPLERQNRAQDTPDLLG